MIDVNVRLAHSQRLPLCVRLAAATAVAALAALMPISPSVAAAPEVKVHQGMLQGVALSDGVSAFLNVPFATPPIGSLRWKPPQPAVPWSGVRQAVKYGEACTQDPKGYGSLFADGGSEDCLNLNIWTPALKPRARAPIMVYVHGGGFTGGAGTIPSFDGTALAHKGVVVVTINYRLGVFGFLAHPELTRESPNRTSGNYGLADQLAALHWVKENIRAFGGDPSHITIFGQSAGAISVTDLMTSPLSHGLFQGAIAESGTPLLSGAGMQLAQAERQGSAFADAQGAASIAQLRAMPAADLQKRWADFAVAWAGRSWPIADGWILPKSPAEVFAAHGEMAIPLMIGNNAREGFGPPKDADLPGRLQSTFGDSASRAAAFYDKSAPPDPVMGGAADMFATDTTFRCPAVVIQTWHARQGSVVYAYQFDETLPGKEEIGAQHSDEVSFVFGTLGMIARMTGRGDLPPPMVRLEDAMVDYWANFAKSGNPNGAGMPEWPRFTTADSAYVHLNDIGIRADTRLRGEACNLYREAVVPALLAHQ